MKTIHMIVLAVAAVALSGCCYRPCPRPMAPCAPSYCAPACAPAAVAAARPVYHHVAMEK